MATSSESAAACSRSAATMTTPWSVQARRGVSAEPSPRRSSSSSWRATSSITARPSASEVVMSTAGEVGPCSAWPSRSAATSSGSALSSAITATSDGPASRSIPTRPNSWRLASATNALPGPTIMSTADRGDPHHRAARRPSPPAPARRRARRSGRRPRWRSSAASARAAAPPRGGEQAITRLHAGDLGHEHRHERAGQHRDPAAGAVGADRAAPGPVAGRGTPRAASRPRSRSASPAAAPRSCGSGPGRRRCSPSARRAATRSRPRLWPEATSKVGGSQSSSSRE